MFSQVILALNVLFISSWGASVISVNYFNYKRGSSSSSTEFLLIVARIANITFIALSPVVLAVGHRRLRAFMKSILSRIIWQIISISFSRSIRTDKLQTSYHIIFCIITVCFCVSHYLFLIKRLKRKDSGLGVIQKAVENPDSTRTSRRRLLDVSKMSLRCLWFRMYVKLAHVHHWDVYLTSAFTSARRIF